MIKAGVNDEYPALLTGIHYPAKLGTDHGGW